MTKRPSLKRRASARPDSSRTLMTDMPISTGGRCGATTLESTARWKRNLESGTLRYQGSFLDEFEQEPGGVASELAAAKAAGVIPPDIPIGGFSELVENDGFQKQKHNLTLSWRKGAYGASINRTGLGEFYQDSLTLDQGDRWWFPDFNRWNATFSYYFGPSDLKVRFRLGIRKSYR